MIRLLLLSTLFSLSVLAQAQVNVEAEEKELVPKALKREKDEVVRLLVRVNDMEGKNLVKKVATKITMIRKNLNWVGIIAPKSAIQTLNNSKFIESVDIDHQEFIIEDSRNVRRRLTETYPWGIPAVLQDVEFWNNLDAPKATKRVCVVDTGYDLGHEDLPKGSDVNGTDGAGEYWGYDGNSHGTHCAGTIAALGGNDIGVVGVIPDNKGGNFKLEIGKAFDKTGSGYSSQTIAAVESCVVNGADIVSLSLGGSSASETTKAYYDELYQDRGVLVVSAAGNRGNEQYSYPASYASAMSVAALAHDGTSYTRSSFSQYNDQVEIAAPGSSVLSTIPGNQYAYYSGTSMATPHVAAVAGLLWMYFPECENYQIRHVIDATAQTLYGSCNDQTGFGLVQAKLAYELLAEGDCGGDLGPGVDETVGGCAELTEASSNSTTTNSSSFHEWGFEDYIFYAKS